MTFRAAGDTGYYSQPGGRDNLAQGVVVLGQRETLALASSVSAGGTQPGQVAYGGDYAIRAIAADWNGASAQVQFLDVDGATWTPLQNQDGSNVAAFTANRTQVAVLASSTQVRVAVTGTPAGLYISAGRLP
jgi:hypothetical protein